MQLNDCIFYVTKNLKIVLGYSILVNQVEHSLAQADIGQIEES